jgi:hypothetical protein
VLRVSSELRLTLETLLKIVGAATQNDSDVAVLLNLLRTSNAIAMLTPGEPGSGARLRLRLNESVCAWKTWN